MPTCYECGEFVTMKGVEKLSGRPFCPTCKRENVESTLAYYERQGVIQSEEDREFVRSELMANYE